MGDTVKKDIAKKWVKALRSGKYKQCTDGHMHKEDDEGNYSYCCLGVLDTLRTGKKTCRTQPHIALPTNACLKWAGLSSERGELKNGGNLACLNDEGKAFKKIADIIEKEWESL
jgi:hypothetical protein